GVTQSRIDWAPAIQSHPVSFCPGWFKAGHSSGWLGSTRGGRRPQIRSLRTGGSLAVASSTPTTQLLSPARAANLKRAKMRRTKPTPMKMRSLYKANKALQLRRILVLIRDLTGVKKMGIVQNQVTVWGGWGRRPEGDAPRSDASVPGARWLSP